MQEDLTRFATFHRSNHPNHRLDFDHSLGTVQLHAVFAAGPKELTVSLYQAVILLLFNDQDEISFAEIKETTRLGGCLS